MIVSILRKDAAAVPPWFLSQEESDKKIKGDAIFWEINTYAKTSKIRRENAWSVQIHL